jgi:hypothetical protein
MFFVLLMVCTILFFRASIVLFIISVQGFLKYLLDHDEPLCQLVIEEGTAIAIFVRCFVDSKGVKMEMEHRLHIRLPKGAHAALSVSDDGHYT